MATMACMAGKNAAAQKLTESLGQPVVVENRPGAAGNLAAEMVARGSSDGYSIKALASVDMKARLASQGVDPVAGGSDEFRQYIAAEIPKWARVIRDAKIPPQ